MGLQLTSRTISSFANSFRIRQRVRTSENGCERNEASRHRVTSPEKAISSHSFPNSI
jgi:hypothetical protein